MKNIEVEIRSFLNKSEYDRLFNFFSKHANLSKEDNQESHYFDTLQDLRIQKNDHYSKVWLKKGKIHDEQREEIEIKFDRDSFYSISQLFAELDYKVKIKWFRKRYQFEWDGITVCLDYTKGYGYIIELEKICDPKNKDKALTELKQKLKELKIGLTPREEFDKQFAHYEKNWQTLTKEPND